MHRNVRSWIALLMLIIVASACVPDTPTGDGTAEADAQGAEDVATVTPIPTAPAAARPTYTVVRGNVEDRMEFSGRWLPRDQMQISFAINGTVEQVNVQRGDTVTAGQLLASYDTTDLENQLANANIQLQTAILNLQSGGENSGQSVVDAQFSLANANLSLENTINSAPWASLESARLTLESAERGLDEAQRNYDDAVSHPENPASAVDSAYQGLLNAQSQLESAQIGYWSAAQSYNNHLYSVQQQENAVLQNEINLQEAQSGTGADPAQLQSVYSAQLSVDEIVAQIAEASLYAPIDGVVLEVNISVGDSATAFETVITLALPEPLEAIASLAFNDTQNLSVGMIGECEEFNQPETRVQCIIRQLPLSSREADQTVRVAASLEGVELGGLVDINMPLQIAENVLWLPPEAIRTFQGRTFVIILTTDGERAVDVQLGLQTTERVEILEVEGSVQEGDIVVGQ
jgi:multidrug efflux pump subunit AcrA (membrane-fusion protein)